MGLARQYTKLLPPCILIQAGQEVRAVAAQGRAKREAAGFQGTVVPHCYTERQPLQELLWGWGPTEKAEEQALENVFHS